MKALLTTVAFLVLATTAHAQEATPATFHIMGVSASVDDYDMEHGVAAAKEKAWTQANGVCYGQATQVTEFTCRRHTAYVFLISCSADFTCEQ